VGHAELWVGRQTTLDLGAPGGRTAPLPLAPETRCSLAHRCQSVRAQSPQTLERQPDPVIANAQYQPWRPRLDRDLDSLRSRVFDDVSERFLHNAEHRDGRLRCEMQLLVRVALGTAETGTSAGIRYLRAQCRE